MMRGRFHWVLLRAASSLGGLLLIGLFVSLFSVAGCGQGSREEPTEYPVPRGVMALDEESEEVADNIQSNMKSFLVTNKVPAGATVTLLWVRKTRYEGMYEANFSIRVGRREGRRSFYFDKEAKHFVTGPVYTVGEIHRARIDPRQMSLLGRPSRGHEDATVTIVEYSDFQCPYCALAAPGIKGFLKRNKGKVRLVFKHLPLTQLHDWAFDAAVISECAGLQDPDAFWLFHDYLYDSRAELKKENLNAKSRKFAEVINLDREKFDLCVANEEPKARIDQDLSEASSYGFTATPTFVIEDVVLVGNQPISVLEEVVQELLQKQEAEKQEAQKR
jgi:protein-disulfide isomerase